MRSNAGVDGGGGHRRGELLQFGVVCSSAGGDGKDGLMAVAGTGCHHHWATHCRLVDHLDEADFPDHSVLTAILLADSGC